MDRCFGLLHLAAFQKKQAEEKKQLAALKDKIQAKGFVKTKVGK